MKNIKRADKMVKVKNLAADSSAEEEDNFEDELEDLELDDLF